MPSEAAVDPALRVEFEAVYAFYASLARDLQTDGVIGGRLLYAGELDRDGSRLVRAANIAGAASLSATDDVSRQRQAVRERVIDFLVTSLDEALRILKNEIRKHNAAAVCVAAPPSRVVLEMRDRGVLPDLVPASRAADEFADFVSQGAAIIEPASLPLDGQLIIATVPTADFESRVLNLIPQSDFATRRWIRLSPRYLGPHARRIRSLWCSDSLAQQLDLES